MTWDWTQVSRTIGEHPTLLATVLRLKADIVLYHGHGRTGLVWFGLVSLFNGISTLFRLFNAKAILLEEQ